MSIPVTYSPMSEALLALYAYQGGDTVHSKDDDYSNDLMKVL